MLKLSHLLITVGIGCSVFAQDNLLPSDGCPEIVPAGRGSYASRPPRDQNKRPHLPEKFGWGDDSQLYSRMPLYVSPENLTGATKRPIPSTDWWTSLVTTRFSGELWMYPSVLKATQNGMEFYTPRHYQASGDGKRSWMSSSVKLVISSDDFTPECAEAVDWSDWMVRGRLRAKDGAELIFSAVHGGICTIFEYSNGMRPLIAVQGGTFQTFLVPENEAKTRNVAMFGLETSDGLYGLYAPKGSKFEAGGGVVGIRFPKDAVHPFLSVAPLNSRDDLFFFAAWAPVVPRSTEVSWEYTPAKAQVKTVWKIATENLAGAEKREALQGWLPHHLNRPATANFSAQFAEYPTPHGTLYAAEGNEFTITFPFTGLLPAYPKPDGKAPGTPFNPALMKQLIDSELGQKDYGTETYWGGKKILHFGRYMEMARLNGMKDSAAVYLSHAQNALKDWFTYTPGEGEHFFSWYPRWGSFVGCRSRDNANPGVDILQDHHMCYGYQVYCAALVFLHDDEFASAYAPMAKLIARDYAEYDSESKLFCRFRNLDPWIGHSWSGGLGSEHGNGQESSSEAMQGYGAMFLLGEIVGDKELRDAAAFCYATEARGIAEYYFDRGHRNFPQIWEHPMSTNVQTEGLGFWTWFSDDPLWKHAIQWLPMSPLLAYLFEDATYARSDYDAMWIAKHNQNDWNGSLAQDSGVANILLNELAGFDAEAAAAIFARLTRENAGGVRGVEAAHTYWRIHALKQLGPHRFDAWTDMPLSQAFGEGGDVKEISWVVCNPSAETQYVRCYFKGVQVQEFTVPAHSLNVMKNGKLTSDTTRVAAAKNTVEAVNLARIAKASSSGDWNGNDAKNAIDGNGGTRWESPHEDGHTLSLDFGGKYEFTSIQLEWEGAYASEFDLETSDDGKNWTLLRSVKNGQGGKENFALSGSGRHLRIHCLKRATQWGNSLFEIVVHGKKDASDSLWIEPQCAVLNENDTTRFTAYRIGRDGKRSPAAGVTWSVLPNRFSGGKIDADGVFTPSGAGNFAEPKLTVTAESQGLSASASAVVEEALRVGRLELAPLSEKNTFRLAQGTEIRPSPAAFDQFGVRLDAVPELRLTGDAAAWDGEVLKGIAPGKAKISAHLAGGEAVYEIEVVSPEKADLAAGRTVSASSAMGANSEQNACDANGETRWESEFSEPQTLRIDFGKTEKVGRIELHWEAAFAKDYDLLASRDGITWETVFTRENGEGGRETIRLKSPREARYLRMDCRKRATAYGFSLWDFEVYSK